MNENMTVRERSFAFAGFVLGMLVENCDQQVRDGVERETTYSAWGSRDKDHELMVRVGGDPHSPSVVRSQLSRSSWTS